MKRLISLLIIMAIMLSLLGSCAKKVEDESAGVDSTVDGAQDDTALPDDLDSEDYSDTSSESHVDTQTQEKNPNLQYNEFNQSQGSGGGQVVTGGGNSGGGQVISGNTITSGGGQSSSGGGNSGGGNTSDNVVVARPYDESKLQLPKVNIFTYNGGDIVSKTDYVSGAVSITNAGNNNLVRTAVEVRGRGNSTWVRFDKKPYKLRFTVKTDLFGMGAAKKWILLANAFDDTMVRSAIVFDLAKQLGLEYTTDYRYVNVYLNNEYQGVYILCEQIEEGDSRIDVNSSKTGEVDTGYLLESYSDGARAGEVCFTLPMVGNSYLGSNPYKSHVMIIKSPDKKIVTQEQQAFIKDYIIKVNNAILSKDWAAINELVDINSFVNMFIVEQTILSNDMGYTFYMYKRAGGKLYLGPVWDYDQSAGNSEHGGSTYKGWYAGSEHKWYTSLIQMPEFCELVRKRYIEKIDVIHGVIDNVDKITTENEYDFWMSNEVYNNFGNKKRWRTIPEIYSLTTYQQHIDYLKTWLSNRFIWMEDQLEIQ